MEITVLEALMAELEPYTAAQVVCKKALIDAGLSEVANDTLYYFFNIGITTFPPMNCIQYKS